MSEHMRTVTLDALALIACAYRGDAESGEMLLATYDEAERRELLAAVIANASWILRAGSEASGVEPDKILGGVATRIREMA